MIKKIRLAALALALPLLAGCPVEPASSGASGVVVKRWTEKARNSPLTIRYITVQEDAGKRSTGRVSAETYGKCHLRDRWPDCKKED